ncbi:MAG: 16S rRNA (cytosine(1402)-N(4))-methyltransferase RsmH [Pseudomonadota bacterium]
MSADPHTVPHVPVMLAEVLSALSPVEGGVFVDGTYGAGGYSRALLDAGAAQVIGIDRDPSAIANGQNDPRLTLVEGVFSDLEAIAREHANGPVDGIVLDIGVSSMQLDQADRGFSFLRDGPLDMRMADDGPSARDLVNRAGENALADVIYHYGEDRASRRIARAIVTARGEAEIETTGRLAEIVQSALPPARPGQIHPATRTFQALRIAVNDELGELVAALTGAENLLSPGGRLVVVTFHSLEDRIVKRFFQGASGQGAQSSRHAPARVGPEPRFERPAKARTALDAEISANPRARSARLRMAVRTGVPIGARVSERALGLPPVPPLARLLELRS